LKTTFSSKHKALDVYERFRLPIALMKYLY